MKHLDLMTENELRIRLRQVISISRTLSEVLSHNDAMYSKGAKFAYEHIASIAEHGPDQPPKPTKRSNDELL